MESRQRNKNMQMSYGNFVETHRTAKDVENALNSTDYLEFRDACNFLCMIPDTGEDDICALVELDDKDLIVLKEIANYNIREKWGFELTSVYDAILRKSMVALVGGKQLYRLYSFGNVPESICSCLKTALSIMALMKGGINGVEDAILMADLFSNPLEPNIYEHIGIRGVNVLKSLIDMENADWDEIAKYLYKGNTASAFNYMQRMLNSTYSYQFGDNIHSISLKEFP